jgi:predicted TIM-barrel fold metal-dependent hydrolase
MSFDDTVSRRTYLSLAGGSLSALAGCTGGGEEAAGTTRSTATATATAAPTTEAPTTEAEDTATSTSQKTAAAVEQMESTIATVEFDGEYFDTHAHWLPAMGSKIPSTYAPAMESHDVGATVLFSPSAQAARNYETFLQQLTDPGVEYLPFMSAPPPGRRLGRDLRALYGEKGAAFWGIGEWKPQTKPYPAFDSKRYTPLWELSADLDIPVMFHPKASQEGTVEPALQSHAETTFILHGHQMLGFGKDGPGLGPTLPRLLREYDNLYWQMDVGVMLNGTLIRLGSSSEFLGWYDSNASQLIEIYQQVLPKLLEAAPERVMWGTDIAQHWNLKDETFSVLIDFTEKVLEGVSKEHRAPYKRQNARQLFDF